MPIELKMPALSPTMEEGTLAKWLVKEGDEVKSGDILAEIETDKATMEVEAVDEGTLAKILIPDGTDNVAVNTPIAVIAGVPVSREIASIQSQVSGPMNQLPETDPRRARFDRLHATSTAIMTIDMVLGLVLLFWYVRE